MTTDDSDLSGGPGAVGGSDGGSESTGGPPARVGEYTWADFMAEHGHGEEVDALYDDGGGLLGRGPSGRTPSGGDWDRVSFDPSAYLGFHPDDLPELIREDDLATRLDRAFYRRLNPDETPVAKDWYTWEHFKREYYYDKNGNPPTSRGGEQKPFEPEEYLGFDPRVTRGVFSDAGNIGEALADLVDERTVTTMDRFDEEDAKTVGVDWEEVEEFDEDDFFSDENGNTTVANRYDMEKTVPREKKPHFLEVDRYWVNKPYAYVVIFHSVKENEKKYYVVEPHINEIESDLMEYLTGKLRNAIKYSDEDVVVEGSEGDRAAVIEHEARQLMKRYGLLESTSGDSGGGGLLGGLFGSDEEPEDEGPAPLEGIEVRPEPAVIAEDRETVNEYQVEKLLYYLKRDFIGYERIDPVKQDTVNVEDVSCDGYNSPVFVYHSEFEQIITNVYHGDTELDDFVVKLAQRSGKGISKRNPQVDATLPDGSRAQLTLGQEVSDHGTNYTIRQFKEVPFTPIDQIAWNTMSLEQVAFLWLSIENEKSMIIAGGTATGKTTLLNALSLFIPSSAKIVSIEDTREVELPQRNWVASVTRPSFGEDDTGDVDEFDLLEAALRQRPEYIVMGEVRGEEGRDLFQVMSTGHCSYSTFHADSVGEVLKRFTTDPINVSKTMFTALDLVAIQTRTRVGGHSVVRNNTLTEINHYDAENDEINVQDIYQWQAETDEFLKMGDSNTLEEVMFDRGWSHDKLQEELFRRKVMLAYLITHGLNTYTEVAATIQAFITDAETVLTLVANDQLEESLEHLREMESVEIDVDPEKEAMAPRPDPDERTDQLCREILDRAEDTLFGDFRGRDVKGLSNVLDDVEPDEGPAQLEIPEDEEEIEFSGELSEDAFDREELEVDEKRPALEGAGEQAAEPATTEGDAATARADDEPGTAAPDETSAGTPPSGGEPAGERGTPAGATAGGGLGDVGGADPDGPDWLFGDEEETFGDEEETFGEDDQEDALTFETSGEDEDDGSAGGLAFGNAASEESDDGGLAFGEGSDDQAPSSGTGNSSGTGSPSETSSPSEAGGSAGGPNDGGLAFGDDGGSTAQGGDGRASGQGGGDGGGLAFGDDGQGDGDSAFGDDGDFAFESDDDGGLAFEDDEDDGGLAFEEEPIEDGGTVPTDDGSEDGGFEGFGGVSPDDERTADDGEDGT